jgi:hypothetical protein
MQQDGVVRRKKGFMIIQDMGKLWHSSTDELFN